LLSPFNTRLKIMTTLFCKIPPILPLPNPESIWDSLEKRGKGRFSDYVNSIERLLICKSSQYDVDHKRHNFQKDARCNNAKCG
jgi:hypothetical protein